MAKRLRTDLGAQFLRRQAFIAAPYLWLIGFFLVPFLIVLKISSPRLRLRSRPTCGAGLRGRFRASETLSLSVVCNYITIAGDDLYVFSYLKSLKVAAASTAILLLCGVPLAYADGRGRRAGRSRSLSAGGLALDLVSDSGSMPGSTSSSATACSMGADLARPCGPAATWLATDTAVYIRLVYSYSAFMVLPFYASFESSMKVFEAAADLGAHAGRPSSSSRCLSPGRGSARGRFCASCHRR